MKEHIRSEDLTTEDPATEDLVEALNAHPSIRGCTVVERHEPRGRLWIAYLSMTPDASTPYSELRETFQERFGRADLPVIFVRLDDLPSLFLSNRRAA